MRDSMYIFISHSSKDAGTASGLCEVLEKNGDTCFMAPRDIHGGCEYAEEIIDGIDKADVMVVVLSENANNSPHVLREVERAVSRAIPIVIYKLEEVQLTKSMQYFLMTHQWVNADNDEGYERIEKCIENLNANNRIKKKSPVKRIVAAALAAAVVVCLGVLSVVALTKQGKTVNDDIKPADTIVFGKYNDEPVKWRVINISEDGTQAVLVSENILTMKAFDAAESGKYGFDGTSYRTSAAETDKDMALQIKVRGNSDWSKSNIRTWLNSDAEVVAYKDQKPIVSAMSDMKNGYDNEAGFLHDFTDEEKAAIKAVNVETKGNALSGKDKVITTDKVYLLSKDELKWFDESGVSRFAVPTDAAVEKDQTKWYKSYSLDLNVNAYYWWLRDPEEGSSSRCYLFGNGYTEENITTKSAGVEGFGIRPAVTVDINAVKKIVGKE
ncbi:MAG: DUF6273 domain-containing protein [Bacteroides sp.]